MIHIHISINNGIITMTHDVAFITEVDNVCGEGGKPLAEMDAIVLKRLGDGHRKVMGKKKHGKKVLNYSY